MDEGIDQYHRMNWTYPQRALRTLLEESECQAIANATVQLICKSTCSLIPSSLGAAFVVDAAVRRDETCRRITARGSNICAFLAPFVCESTVHLLQGMFSRDGAHSPGAIFEAQEVLKRRRPDLGNSKLCQPDRAQP
ncbi:MAG TPA: hypothetical protein VME23_13435 [Terracidiphilus sp.]|nr:hypothetical protein [Terracidiphilus sp.]